MNKEGIKATNRVSVKRRSVSVYLPTDEMVDRWKRMADKAGLSLSQYVQNIVDDYIWNKILNVLGDEFDEHIDDIKEQNRQLKKLGSVLSDRHKIIGDMSRMLKKSMISLENQQFRENSPLWKMENYKLRIITFLKEQDVTEEHELLDFLHIDHDDTESEHVKFLNQLLEDLVNFNLIKRRNGKITWVK